MPKKSKLKVETLSFSDFENQYDFTVEQMKNSFQAVQKFEFMHDFFRATVDLVDLVGIYLVMQRVSG